MDRDPREFSRREFVGAGIAAASLGLTPAGAPIRSTRREPDDFALDEITVDDLQTRMQKGSATATSIAQQYLARVEAMDQRGPAVNAIIELNPDALQVAAQCDAERKAGQVRSALHGIPVLIKDNIDTADRMKTSAGSLALAENIALRDAHIVEKLRAAGAVILGKTNLSEWANFRSTHSSSGWSGRGGQTRNPYALDRTPSGSSAGSGAAVAANFCTVAVGTETDGSVTSPAAVAGLVGIKPTVGLLSRGGIIPISHVQDTAGPMARTVRDAAILLELLVGADSRDPATRRSAGHTFAGYTRALDRDGLRGARLGVVRKHYTGYHPATDNVFNDALDQMRRLGAIIIDPADIPTAGQFDDPEFDALLWEFKADLNAYLKTMPPSVASRSLSDLIAYNTANAPRELQVFGQEIMEMANRKTSLRDPKYITLRARTHRLAAVQGIDVVMKQHRLDALIAPTQGPAWLIDLVSGDPGGIISFTGPAAVAGYPHITVPMGQVHGLPVGLSFVGKAWTEPALLKYAYAFEQAAPARRKPTFATTAG